MLEEGFPNFKNAIENAIDTGELERLQSREIRKFTEISEESLNSVPSRDEVSLE